MIVKNEERFLERCLASVSGVVDEINIVDTGSTDRTIEIAKQFGAKIEHREWRSDFAWARNESLAMATKRWILQLDADEELLAESRVHLEMLKSAPAHLTGVWLRCINSSDRYAGGGTISHAIIRMFPRSERIRFTGAVHEFPSIDGAPISMGAVTSPIKILHHGYLSDVVTDRDKFVRNMSIVEKTVQADPHDAFHWYNLGLTAHLGGEQQRAAQALERMWELCLEHGMRAFTANGLQILADVYSEHLSQPEKGLVYALECLKRAPRYANAHFSAGKAYFLMKRYDEAREMYASAIEDGEYADRQFIVDDGVAQWKAQCEIGSTYAEQGDDVKALEWFERGLANQPRIQPLRANRAAALERLGRLSEAQTAYRSIYEDFGDEYSSVTYVNYLLRHSQDRDAVTLIEREYGRVSQEAAVTMLLAGAYVTQKNEWGDGERYLIEAQRIDPANADVVRAVEALQSSRGQAGALFAAASGALTEKQYERALEAAQRGRSAFPRDGRFAYYAALACANMDRKDEALQYLAGIADESLGAAPFFLQAALLRELGRPQEALDAIERALMSEPHNLDAALVRATLLDALGRSGEAESTLRAALPAGKRRVAVELASLYLRQGRLDEAKSVAEQALV